MSTGDMELQMENPKSASDSVSVDASQTPSALPAVVERVDRSSLVAIAKSTLQKIEQGSYELDGVTYNLKDSVEAMKDRTTFYPARSDLSEWAQVAPSLRTEISKTVQITLSECSTLSGARTLKSSLDSMEGIEDKRVGVLNFASAKSPGGGFLGGSRSQEESIARSSTMYPSLKTELAEPFYQSHKKNPKNGLYSHAMIYSPGVLLLRSHEGDWLSPVEVDMVTSPAVNAGTYRAYLRKINSGDESEVEVIMRERMARILYLFERQGVRNLVLGSFGTGAFKNKVDLVAGIWKDLLVPEEARFKYSFDRIVFAILGTETYQTFQTTFAENDVGT